VYHLIHRFFVIFAEINGPTGGLTELSATGAIEKATSGANDCSMDRPLTMVACDGEIRVFSAHVEPAECQSDPRTRCRYDLRGERI